MPRVRPGQTSVTHGEVTKRLGGRIDLEQFLNSAELLENFQVLETGAFSRRPGLRFLGRTKYQTSAAAHVAHLVPFIPSNEQPYMLEVGELYIRVHRADGTTVESAPGVPLEVVTPYLTADVPAFKYAPSNDVRYIFSAFYPPKRLERYADDVWKLRGVSERIGPSYGSNPPPAWEYGTRPLAGGTLVPSAMAGAGAFMTAGADTFRPSDVGSLVNPGREIVVLRGPSTGARARIIAYVSPTVVQADISEPFASTGVIAATDWKITGSPLALLTPGAAGPEGTNISLTLDMDGWRLNDAVKFLRFNGGLVELNSYGPPGPFNPQVVNGTIRVPFVPATNATAAQPGSWSLEEPLWSPANGYPAAGCFAGGRLVTGGVPVLPDRIDGSRVNDLENFAGGTLDDDAFAYILRSNRVNVVRWLVETAGGAVAVGTSGDGFALTGGSIGDPITPSNVQATPATSYGSNPTGAPIRLGNVLLYLSEDGRRLIELVQDYLSKSYLDPDLLLLSSHLTAPTRIRAGVLPHRFTKIWLQRSPIRTVWALREDGVVGVLTYLREQNVIGWSRCVTDGFVEDGDAIPKGDGTGDRVWVVVRRNVTGGVVRCIEWFDDDGLIYDTLHTDGAVTFNGMGHSVLTPGTDFVLNQDAIGTFTVPPISPAFGAADAGRQIWEASGPGQAAITVVDSPTLVHAQVLVPFSSADPLPAETWGVARRDLSGLEHHEGQPVWVVGDGAPQDRYAERPVVVGGNVTARFFAIAFEVGRHYRSLFKSQKPPLSLGGSQSEAVKKRLSQVVLRVLDSLNVLVNGKRELERDATDLLDRAPRLRSTDIPMTLLGIDRAAQVTIEQDMPLPLTVLYIQPTIGVSGP